MSRDLRRGQVFLASGAVRGYQPAQWHDALVLVQYGERDLEALDSARPRFGAGTVLCLVGLPLRLLCNVGVGRVVLVVISRGGTDSFPTAPPSHGRKPWRPAGREYG